MSAAYLTLLLADGRLPTGAHTQSAGLEPALNHGLRLDQVPDYLRARLATVTAVEAAAAVVARHLWDRTRSPAALATVDRGWRVRTTSAALRDASDLLGRSYLRLAGSLWPALAALTEDRAAWCRAVAVGATAAEAGLDPAQTARLVGFEDVQTVLAAAVKLQPFDPSIAVAWSMAAGREVAAMVEQVAGCSRVEDIPAYAAPQIEHWAELHTRTERRLFRA
ncbi:MAG TPA: urease accessory UreF family protein [Microlunatus sp.]|nr:urease accessory UreF family protein [Microlunatus sp.]